MREISFRGKDFKGQWIKFNLFSLNMLRVGRLELGTIGQYTGLKDKNGVEIYEGDIVRFTKGIHGYKSTYDTYITKVEYWVQKCGISQFEPFCTSDMIECEVIGNIYDNPELLEVEK